MMHRYLLIAACAAFPMWMAWEYASALTGYDFSGDWFGISFAAAMVVGACWLVSSCVLALMRAIRINQER